MRPLVDQARALGLDGVALDRLRGQEPWEALEVPERVRRGDAMWRLALETSPDPAALPARYAALWRVEDLGALGLAMRSADTLGEALARLDRYNQLFLPAPMWRFERDPERLRAICLWAPPLDPVHVAVSVEFLVALLAELCAQLTGQRVPAVELCFQHEARGPFEALERAIGCPPAFGATRSSLCLPACALELPLRQADPAISALLLGELEALAVRPQRHDAGLLLERLRTTVSARLPAGPPAMPEIARRVGLSERTLRRRLAETGTTWEELVDQVREAAARAWVDEGEHSLAEVSYLLGYSEPSAFHRAFRRWTGMTPVAYRGR